MPQVPHISFKQPGDWYIVRHDWSFWDTANDAERSILDRAWTNEGEIHVFINYGVHRNIVYSGWCIEEFYEDGQHAAMGYIDPPDATEGPLCFRSEERALRWLAVHHPNAIIYRYKIEELGWTYRLVRTSKQPINLQEV